MGTFTGKVALVTGGSYGIGQAAALRFAERGAKVVIAARGREKGEETVAQIKAMGAEAVYIPVDIGDQAAVNMMVAGAVDAFGQINIVVNSAGLEGAVMETADCTEENWFNVINTNLNGTFYLMKAAIPHLLNAGGGAIVNVVSIIGVIAFPGLPAYTASKAGIIGLTKTAALEYAKRGIRINAVAPGSIRTPMYMRFSGGTPEAEAYMSTFHPLGRIGEPPECGDAIVWLCSDEASFITGHTLPVAGGWEVP